MHFLVDLFWESMITGVPPSEDFQHVFAIEAPIESPDGPLGSCRLGTLVFACWRELKSRAMLEKLAVAKSILQGQLPKYFHGRIDDAMKPCSQNSFPCCNELSQRDVWSRLPWDFQTLSALAIDMDRSSGVIMESPQPSATKRSLRVVWIKVPKEPFGDHSCASAPKQELLVERTATCEAMQAFLSKSGWVQFSCQFLQFLCEDIALFAEPSRSHYPHEELNKRKNPAATYLISDRGLRAISAICGKPLLVRRNGADLKQETVAKLCYFMDAAMGIREACGALDESTLDSMPLEDQKELWQRGLNRVASSWPRYEIGDVL